MFYLGNITISAPKVQNEEQRSFFGVNKYSSSDLSVQIYPYFINF